MPPPPGPGAWDLAFQRATVLVWIISNGPSVAHDVAAHLAGSGDGETAIRVTEAVDEGATLAVGIEHHRDHDRTSVEAAVRDALIGEDNGLFAPSRVKLGEAFYRSVVSAAVMAVTGVRAVRSIHINGAPAPVAIAVSEGTYLAFDGVTIG